ncbi:leucine-rich repeats and immunoglobulin-like domains protein 1 [Lineus longissimus]|uniref:leucine-rich repeats and immunoglobulin-like domains protein 1 n=1 Tax=Lineus longissimus TaxID=88925 RepID=UPI002B4CBD22
MRLLVLSLLALFCANSYACPDSCTCDLKLKAVTCPGVDYQGLLAVVANLSTDTTTLTIGSPVGNASVTFLSNDTFIGITAKGLTSLTLCSTGLLTIDDHALQPLKKLTSITLTGNPLTNISRNLIVDNPSLTELAITKSPNLQTFSSIAGGENLKSLDLSNNGISTIPNASFNGLDQLTTLNLANNKFDVIGAGMFQGIDDTLLDLNLSQLTPPKTVQTKPFELLHSLTSLKFAGIVNKTFSAMIFSGLTALQRLDVSNNGLTEIPFEAMGQFSAVLTELVADDNKVIILKAIAFEQLQKLDHLSLERNGLKEIKPGPFHANPKLAYISLKGNNLTSIPTKMFAHLPQLKELDLSGCGLENLETDTFAGAANLTSLNLAGSVLANITSGPFDPLVSLSTLDLSYSSVRSIEPGAFGALKALNEINLDMNLLEGISDDLLRMFKDNNVTVIMGHNLWDCSCEGMEKTKDFLEQSNYTTPIICSSPEELKGRDVADIAKNQICYGPNITNCCHVDLRAELGETLTFFCNVTGSPQPDITYHEISGNPLPRNRTKFSADKTMVTVYNVTNQNNGNFTCFAGNTYGNITNYFELFVLTPEPTMEPAKPYKEGSLTWIILGVAIAVVFIVTVIGLIVYFVRKRDRNPTELLVNSMENNIP